MYLVSTSVSLGDNPCSNRRPGHCSMQINVWGQESIQDHEIFFLY